MRCARLLTVEELWRRPNDSSNAVGNLIIHLNGNVSEWILKGVGGEAYERDRDAEFAQREPLDTDRIIEALQGTLSRARRVIWGLDSSFLADSRTIQGYDVSVLRAVFHVVEHFSWHAGQVVYATKALRNVDLSLYDAQGRLWEAGGDKGP